MLETACVPKHGINSLPLQLSRKTLTTLALFRFVTPNFTAGELDEADEAPDSQSWNIFSCGSIVEDFGVVCLLLLSSPSINLARRCNTSVGEPCVDLSEEVVELVGEHKTTLFLDCVSSPKTRENKNPGCKVPWYICKFNGGSSEMVV